jgi:carboxyl-terminal processing protease
LAAARGEPRSHSPYHALTTFAKVLAHVRASYVDDVDENQLIQGAVRGLVRSLDPYSAYMSPEEFRVLRSDTQGRFGGIGCEVDARNGLLLVMAALEGTPAARAGLRRGDRILEIDGLSTEGMSLQNAVVRMRGRPGTVVRLSLRRDGVDEPLSLAIERAEIDIESVEGRLINGNVAYLRLRMFQEDSARRLRQELQRLERDSGGLVGAILDVRGNPGGLVDQAVEIADLFLAQGVIVTTRGRGGRMIAEERARRRGTVADLPLVVLVDGQSASASEIVAGALQDNRRATIIGEGTYGKGSVQNVIELPDGSGLKLTIARYHTPGGRSLAGRGLEPDIAVAGPPGGAHRAGPGERRVDPPLDRALAELRRQQPSAAR